MSGYVVYSLKTGVLIVCEVFGYERIGNEPKCCNYRSKWTWQSDC